MSLFSDSFDVFVSRERDQTLELFYVTAFNNVASLTSAPVKLLSLVVPVSGATFVCLFQTVKAVLCLSHIVCGVVNRCTKALFPPCERLTIARVASVSSSVVRFSLVQCECHIVRSTFNRVSFSCTV